MFQQQSTLTFNLPSFSINIGIDDVGLYMYSFYKIEQKVLASHQVNNVRLVFTKSNSEGVTRGLFKLSAYVDNKPAMLNEKEFLPSVYMEESLFSEYSTLMSGSTSNLALRLKQSCWGTGESLYRMALLLENNPTALEQAKNISDSSYRIPY